MKLSPNEFQGSGSRGLKLSLLNWRSAARSSSGCQLPDTLAACQRTETESSVTTRQRNTMFQTAQEKYDDLREHFPSRHRNAAEEGRNVGVDRVESVLALGAAVGATFLARHALQAGWRSTLHREPPKNPASPEVDWTDALIWGAVSGALIGVVRIASRRASSNVYHRISA